MYLRKYFSKMILVLFLCQLLRINFIKRLFILMNDLANWQINICGVYSNNDLSLIN